MSKLPGHYFRIRDNGAAVYRIEGEDRHRRFEMTQIAVLNIRNGEVKPHGNQTLTEADSAAIKDWMSERRATLDQRDADEIRRTIEFLNLTAQWAQSKAKPDELDAITDDLLLAMHDLRSVLVRKKADRMSNG